MRRWTSSHRWPGSFRHASRNCWHSAWSAKKRSRRFDNIVAELESAFRVHSGLGSYLGGVHLELTSENVTECTGGARGLTDGDLARAYKSTVDPRLNYEQAMEVAMRIAGLRQ